MAKTLKAEYGCRGQQVAPNGSGYRRWITRFRDVAARRTAILAELAAAAADGDDADVTGLEAVAAVAADRLGEGGLAALARVFAGPERADGVTESRYRRQRAGARGLAASVEDVGWAVSDPARVLGAVREAVLSDADFAANRPDRLLGRDVAEAAGRLVSLIEAAEAGR